ncbi:peptide deformylase [Hoeflea prorocentri]|uniref:Peptide deformylase n=1 Tax=Hoeflea prorocentri TaxID=1922333 RepID=A0A9X3UK68_9HYPH|nr:peptide deformylase [Hoeflea prorocentri]MCY6381920.1 peptide deformylase [Hoeflea prorocentri]MDA5399720.1 peptide deformylase [Hoeflea prorocentri]
MSILKIARMGHPILAAVAEPVQDPTSHAIKALANDMIETLYDTAGNGLAATQVHVPQRVIIFFQTNEEWSFDRLDEPPARRFRPPADNRLSVPLTLLVNPEYEPVGDDTVEGYEGCLSIPGLAGKVRRYRTIRYRGITPDGQLVERTAEGAHAQVVQHECDHLDGILYPERMTDLKDLTFMTELKLRQGEA